MKLLSVSSAEQPVMQAVPLSCIIENELLVSTGCLLGSFSSTAYNAAFIHHSFMHDGVGMSNMDKNIMMFFQQILQYRSDVIVGLTICAFTKYSHKFADKYS